MKKHKSALASVITVGDGRGFVIDVPNQERLVVTAAHCLSSFPPRHGASDLQKRTYQKLLAPLGNEAAVWAECRFADPISDTAVLGSADDQELWKEAAAYKALVDSTRPIRIAGATAKAWLLSLDGKWFHCSVENRTVRLLLSDLEQPITFGVSGSPIVSDEGMAIGIVALSRGPDSPIPNPSLLGCLQGWLLRTIRTH